MASKWLPPPTAATSSHLGTKRLSSCCQRGTQSSRERLSTGVLRAVTGDSSVEDTPQYSVHRSTVAPAPFHAAATARTSTHAAVQPAGLRRLLVRGLDDRNERVHNPESVFRGKSFARMRVKGLLNILPAQRTETWAGWLPIKEPRASPSDGPEEGELGGTRTAALDSRAAPSTFPASACVTLRVPFEDSEPPHDPRTNFAPVQCPRTRSLTGSKEEGKRKQEEKRTLKTVVAFRRMYTNITPFLRPLPLWLSPCLCAWQSEKDALLLRVCLLWARQRARSSISCVCEAALFSVRSYQLCFYLHFLTRNGFAYACIVHCCFLFFLVLFTSDFFSFFFLAHLQLVRHALPLVRRRGP